MYVFQLLLKSFTDSLRYFPVSFIKSPFFLAYWSNEYNAYLGFKSLHHERKIVKTAFYKLKVTLCTQISINAHGYVITNLSWSL